MAALEALARYAGHTSWSFSSLFFLSLYLFKFLCTGGQPAHGWALLAAVVPTVVAAWVGATRVTDYYHNPSDVVAGALLGIVIAVLVFKTYVVAVTGKRASDLQLGRDEGIDQRHSVNVDVASLARYRSPSQAGSLEASSS